MSQHTSSQTASAISEYTPRATSYEAANAGWHAELADDFVTWVKPTAGEAVLDVACGTGLVTFRMAEKVDKDGIVVGVDITPAMLDVAREKLDSPSTNNNSGNATAEIEFAEADIANQRQISEIPAVKRVLEQRGGFDIVSCCSALVLLDDPAAALKVWTSLLKKGGRLIVDVATERWTIQYLATEVLGQEVGVKFPFSRAWVKGKESVEGVLEEAGLGVEMSFVTRSYLPERVFGTGEGERVFEEEVMGKFGRVFVENGMVEVAREKWRGVWERAVRREGQRNGDGRLWDGHWLYVCVGWKR